MRFVLTILLALAPILASAASDARVIKVLPHYLDAKGRHTLGPSLFERDAYQAELRANPAKRSALRFDINWKTPSEYKNAHVTIRLEIRTANHDASNPLKLEKLVKGSGRYGAWSELLLDKERLEKAGDLVAWRATIWVGDDQIAEERSFLW